MRTRAPVRSVAPTTSRPCPTPAPAIRSSTSSATASFRWDAPASTRRTRPDPAPGVTSPWPLVGRDRELEVIAAALTRPSCRGVVLGRRTGCRQDPAGGRGARCPAVPRGGDRDGLGHPSRRLGAVRGLGPPAAPVERRGGRWAPGRPALDAPAPHGFHHRSARWRSSGPRRRRRSPPRPGGGRGGAPTGDDRRHAGAPQRPCWRGRAGPGDGSLEGRALRAARHPDAAKRPDE